MGGDMEDLARVAIGVMFCVSMIGICTLFCINDNIYRVNKTLKRIKKAVQS